MYTGLSILNNPILINKQIFNDSEPLKRLTIFSEIDDTGFGHPPPPSVCRRYSLSSL